MAKKRAQIDLVLTVTAASDIFDQDLDDLPEELREEWSGDRTPKQPAIRRPQSRSASDNPREPTTGKVSDGAARTILSMAQRKGIGADAIAKQFGVAEIGEIDMSKVNDVLKWMQDQSDAEGSDDA